MDYNEKTKEELLSILKLAGIAKVVINYSGSGDSGQMDSVEAWARDATDPESIDTLIARAIPDKTLEHITKRLLGQKIKL